jgi:hypothetical protein
MSPSGDALPKDVPLAVAKPRANTTTLHASADTMIREEADLAIWGNNSTFMVGASNVFGINRGLVKFDLSVLPPEAQITAAELWAYYDVCSIDCAEMTVTVHRLLESWTEDTAIWSDLNDASGAAVIATATIPEGRDRLEQWFSWDVTPLAQAWAKERVPNHGLALHGYEGTDQRYKEFAAQDRGIEFAPQLVVQWQQDPPPAMDQILYIPLLLK